MSWAIPWQRVCHGGELAFALLCYVAVRPVHFVVAILWMLAVLAVHELSQVPLNRGPVTAVNESPARPAPPRLDIYGNQIQEAVGDYRVDPRGELYERHAPDTAVLRLGPPRT